VGPNELNIIGEKAGRKVGTAYKVAEALIISFVVVVYRLVRSCGYTGWLKDVD